MDCNGSEWQFDPMIRLSSHLLWPNHVQSADCAKCSGNLFKSKYFYRETWCYFWLEPPIVFLRYRGSVTKIRYFSWHNGHILWNQRVSQSKAWNRNQSVVAMWQGQVICLPTTFIEGQRGEEGKKEKKNLFCALWEKYWLPRELQKSNKCIYCCLKIYWPVPVPMCCDLSELLLLPLTPSGYIYCCSSPPTPPQQHSTSQEVLKVFLRRGAALHIPMIQQGSRVAPKKSNSLHSNHALGLAVRYLLRL